MFDNYEIKVYNDTSKNPELKDFVFKNHYLKSISRGNKKCFGLYINSKLVGVSLYGYPVGKNLNKVYNRSNILELKRFCLSPNLPKNSASWFIAKTMRILKRYNVKNVISYADPTQGHEGIIYKASNFQYLGKQKYPTIYYQIGNKKVGIRNFYCKKTNKYDIFKGMKHKRVYAQPKHIFMYEIK